jgi:hypothetical protein
VVLLAGVGVAAYFAFFAPSKAPPGPPAREPLRVDGKRYVSLSHALLNAADGDRIVVSKIVEETVHVDKKNLTIEAAPNAAVVWRPPMSMKAGSGGKLLIVANAEGLQLRGITLDGGGRADTLINIFGRCPGTKFERLQLKGFLKQAVYVTNAEGDANNPIRFANCAFDVPAGKTGVLFDILPSLRPVTQNRHFSFRDCAFQGPGARVRYKRGSAIDKATIELPPGTTLEEAP